MLKIDKNKMTENVQKQLVKAAFDLGAVDAKVFNITDICFDPRTFLKCLFGCRAGYHYCPSRQDVTNSLTYADIIKKYQWGIIICTDSLPQGQIITLALESQAFLAGYYFALGVTECASCKKCSSLSGQPCIDKKKQRLPLYALGIDVYKTVRGLGWELNVVQCKGDAAKNITAVFVE